MWILKINKKNINAAVTLLKRGGVVVYPTETAYALGCDATNEKAIAKIFRIKNRSKDKNLPMICATKKMAQDFFKLGKIEKNLAKKYWPGPLTIIIETKKQKNKKVKEGGTAVRVSSNKIACALSRGLRRLIISTSANVSGEPALYDAKKIAESFARKKFQPDLILDAGKLPMRKPSTIIKIENKKIIILRQGEVRISNFKLQMSNEYQIS